jgi:hypothetical protein
METMGAYDYLSHFKTVQDDKLLVEMTTNELAHSLALYQIQTFKAI